jgi:cytosine/adenosine deaminase-related metal-dependent hydrolase
VDTHRHVWQSPLKGFFGDTALFRYLAIGSCTQCK